MTTKVAALFVARGGVYYGLPDVDPWDEERDARTYTGPHPVVAHPPCARWGKMAVRAFGKTYGVLGDDDGCFASALDSVNRWAGVLEHPAHSKAFPTFGLTEPRQGCGWARSGQGWVIAVEQGFYGHRTRKLTWLYAVTGRALPPLSLGVSCPPGYEPGATRNEVYTRLSHRQRASTPRPFRDMLLDLARRAQTSVASAV